jgi:hypothetical protein
MRAPQAHRDKQEGTRKSVSIATSSQERDGARDRVQRRDRLTAAPGTGAVIAIAEGDQRPFDPALFEGTYAMTLSKPSGHDRSYEVLSLFKRDPIGT